MKYTISINQLVLAKTSLDITDCAILDFLITMCNSRSPKIESRRKEGFTPIDYKYMISEMPLLRIKTPGALTPRIEKIELEGYVEIRRSNGRNSGVKLTEKVDELFMKLNADDDKAFTKLNGSVHETKRQTPKSVHETKPIIILSNHYTNHNTADAEYVLEFWNLGGIVRHKISTLIISRIQKALKDYSRDEVIKSIKNYQDVFLSEETYFKHKWTLDEFLKRSNALPVFLHKGVEDYKKRQSEQGPSVIDLETYVIPTNN